MANQWEFGLPDDFSSVQIEVKKVTDSIVICNLLTGGTSSEIMLKRADYDALLEKGFFRQHTVVQQQASGTVASTEVYGVTNPQLVP